MKVRPELEVVEASTDELVLYANNVKIDSGLPVDQMFLGSDILTGAQTAAMSGSQIMQGASHDVAEALLVSQLVEYLVTQPDALGVL